MVATAETQHSTAKLARSVLAPEDSEDDEADATEHNSDVVVDLFATMDVSECVAGSVVVFLLSMVTCGGVVATTGWRSV